MKSKLETIVLIKTGLNLIGEEVSPRAIAVALELNNIIEAGKEPTLKDVTHIVCQIDTKECK